METVQMQSRREPARLVVDATAPATSSATAPATPASPVSGDYLEEVQQWQARRMRSKALLDDAKGGEDRTGQTLLNTFMGVFVPTTQNILGIILFIRLPFITAQAGIFQAACIVGMACFSATLTSLSMSGIATNGRVSAGGCYQIIKKSLGEEFGGVVGILLFLSNNFGVAMYVLGFVEALQYAFPDATVFGRDENGDLKDPLNENRVIGSCTLLFLVSIVYVGISYISKFAMLFLTGVLTAIFSIFLGVFVRTGYPNEDKGVPGLSWDNFSANWGPDYTTIDGESYSFSILLALFFPAVTDPLAGSNLSGDLRDAAKSIPPGTLLAVGFTTLIFLSQVVITGGAVDRTVALTNNLIVTDVGWPVPHIIFAGIMLSTLGAGLQSLAGAPRLLAAIARDDLIPVLRPLVPPSISHSLSNDSSHNLRQERWKMEPTAREICAPVIDEAAEEQPETPHPELTDIHIPIVGAPHTREGQRPQAGQEPRKIVLLCAVLSMSVLMMGELNAVAPFITMWFLTCYSIINGACFMLSFDASPSFRPTWRYFHWSTSLAGMCICLGMMFFIYWQFALAALVFSMLLYKFMERQLNQRMHDEEEGNDAGAAARADWTSGRRYNNCRESLLKLKERDMEFKYWRPFVLFLCKLDKEEGTYVPQSGMINLISQLMKRGKGMSFIAGVVKGEYNRSTAAMARKAQKHLAALIAEKGIEGFPEVVVAPTIGEGQRYMVQGKGFGVLRPNTVMMGFPSNLQEMSDESKRAYCAVMRDAEVAGKTLVICKGQDSFPTNTERMTGFIDVWWVFDILPARGLLLLIPYLLRHSKVWAQTQMRLFVVTGFEEDINDLKATLTGMMKAAGMKAQVHVVQMQAEDAPRYTHLGTPVSNAGDPEEMLSSARLDPSGMRSPLTLGEEAHEWLDTIAHKQAEASFQTAAHRMARMSETEISDDALSTRSVARAGSINQLTDYLAAISIDMGPQREDSTISTAPNSPMPVATTERATRPSALQSMSSVTEEELQGASRDSRGITHVYDVKEGEPSMRRRRSARKSQRRSITQLLPDKYGSTLTAAFAEYSSQSALACIALPKKQRDQTPEEFLESLSILIKDIPRVIMVQESGVERVQLL